jgi:hypothetical protein
MGYFDFLRVKSLKRQWGAERSALERDVEHQAQERSCLVEVLTAFLSPVGSRKALAQSLVDAASRLCHAEIVVALFKDPLSLEFVVEAGRGMPPEDLARLRVLPGEKIDEGLLPPPSLVVPLKYRADLNGLLVLAKPRGGAFSSEAKSMAELLALQAATAADRLDLSNTVEHFYDEMAETLARAVAAKDAYTHKHSDRTRSLVQAMGQEIHLPKQLIHQIEQGAFLHDLGKIGIEDAILKKTGKLTAEEYAIIKTHPAIGHQILSSIDFLMPVASIVLYHQEWFNGQGYPEGLAGEEIPLGARVVAIIDAWDAMTSDRTYRKAMAKSAAIAELRRQAGTQFDPKLVDAFLRVIDRLEREGIPTTEEHEQEPKLTPAA